MTPFRYLIVEPVSIIASDLALSVQDYDIDATVLAADTLQAAVTLLAGMDPVHFAFIHADPTLFDGTELGLALAEQNTVCVFMGDAAERAQKALIVLDRPFSPLTIAALLARLMADNSVKT